MSRKGGRPPKFWTVGNPTFNVPEPDDDDDEEDLDLGMYADLVYEEVPDVNGVAPGRVNRDFADGRLLQRRIIRAHFR